MSSTLARAANFVEQSRPAPPLAEGVLGLGRRFDSSRRRFTMSKHYKIILLVRFFGYFLFFSGLVSLFFLLGPLIQAEAKYRTDKILGFKRTVPGMTGESGPVNFGNIAVFGQNIIPVSTQYGIVIEKIGANAKVVPGVNPANEKEYSQALKNGVAEALGSTKPGEPGNLYLFSHSTDAPWNIIRFNAIFYLLKELEIGDTIIIFHKDKRYDYIVFDKTVASPDDISYLTNRYDSPILTLQTCDPPGTLLNRLVIRAKLVSS